MTYLYEVLSTGEQVEVEQRITEAAHQTLEVNGKVEHVRRLIAGTPAFDLRSGPTGGWAASGYSKPENHRWAESTLGRPLVPPNGGR